MKINNAAIAGMAGGAMLGAAFANQGASWIVWTAAGIVGIVGLVAGLVSTKRRAK